MAMTLVTLGLCLAAMMSGITPPMEIPASVTSVQIELVEKALDRLDEQFRRIVRLGDVGKSVTGIIRRVDGEGFRERGHDLLENVELGP